MNTATDIVPKTNAELNKLLCESKNRIPVWETISATVKRIPNAVAESDGPTGTNADFQYEAKLFHVDRMNTNNRVYTRKGMQANVQRLQPMLKTGGFNGSVDHATGLKNQVVMWKELHIDPDGSGLGKFTIVPGHTVGEDLRKQIDAGMSVGFSTYGYGSGHTPDADECEEYDIPEDLIGVAPKDGGAVVMNDDYEMVKCDAVDDPSVTDARIKAFTPPTNVPGPGGYTGNSRTTQPVAENTAAATPESCSNGLHWVEKAFCGHVLSQCKCECDEKERHTVWRDTVCEKCKASGASMTVAEFKAKFAESKKRQPVVEAHTRKPLATHYTQYIQSKDGDSFEPVGKLKTVPKLEREAYAIVQTWSGIRFDRIAPQTDDLYRFPNSVMESVIAEIDKFWDLKPKFDALGLMHNRGIIMEGPPGNGKTSALNQIVELIVGRGDVVFYADNVNTLMAGLNAFREVEPDRKVVVALEDADQYIGYQERAMLNLLDGAQSVSGVCYVATTNYLSRFPERLLRPGRFDKHVHVGPPPIEGRRVYLSKKLDGIEKAEEIERLAKETDGLSFGHLRELITAVYALSEPVNDVLSRLKGKSKSSSHGAHRLSSQKEHSPSGEAVKESRMEVVAESGRSVHLNHAGVAHAMAAARAGDISHGPFDGGAIERSSVNATKFLAVDTAHTPDEKGHWMFPVFTGDKVSAKGVGTAGHYAEKDYPEIHSATVKISDAIKEHEDKGAPSKDSRGDQMDKAIVEQFNKLAEALKDVEGVNIPQREVLPAEFREQLDKANGVVAERDAKIATLESEKSELAKQVESFKAEKANAERLAKVSAKAESLLKDNSFADQIRPRIAEAAKDDKFVESSVEAFIKTKTDEYDAIMNRKPKIDTSVSGVGIQDAELEKLETEEDDDEPTTERKTESAPELEKMFGKRKK